MQSCNQYKWLTDKTFGGAYQLHTLDQKPLRINSQADGIVDQSNRDHQQYACKTEDNDPDRPYVFIDHVDQRALIDHFFHDRVFLNCSFKAIDALVICIIGFKINIKSGAERVVAQEI